MAFGTLNTSESTTFRLHTASAYDTRTFLITSDANTEAIYGRFTIAKGAADTALDFGHLASCDSFVIRASEGIDNVYVSTVVGAHLVAAGQTFIAMSGLDSITTIHLDCTGSAAAVEIQYMLVSNE